VEIVFLLGLLVCWRRLALNGERDSLSALDHVFDHACQEFGLRYSGSDPCGSLARSSRILSMRPISSAS
jgi:hypothetical protein